VACRGEWWRRWFEAVFSEMWARLYLASNIVRDCNVYGAQGGAPGLCDVYLEGRNLCREGISLFKQANKLFFADQEIY